MDAQCEPASMPASCIAPVPCANDNRLARRQTIIEKGVLSEEQAVALFTIYRDCMDHLLYRILDRDGNLDNIMKSSPLLAAAVLTVGALHSVELGHLYEPCLTELKELVAAESLFKHHNMDDVRGFCIGSFWLGNLSWALSGSGTCLPSQFHHSLFGHHLNMCSRKDCLGNLPPSRNTRRACRRPGSIHEDATVLSCIRVRPPQLHLVRPASDEQGVWEREGCSSVPRDRTCYRG